MPTPRKQQVSLEDTPWYHCVSKCVRGAFLYGYDQQSGRSYKHRRQWIVDRLMLQTQAFSIDVAGYAVMSNHHHVVLRVDGDKAKGWTTREVIEHWHMLFQGTFLSRNFVDDFEQSPAELRIVKRDANIWRARLTDISWFMRALNEPIARRANAEDNCTGKFYESRFKSQALLDLQAILSCLIYCDLNPIRAQIASTPETSEDTSAHKRITAAAEGTIPTMLAPFQDSERPDQSNCIPFAETDYLELLDLTGRAIRDDKPGYIDNTLPPILQRLNIDGGTWLHVATTFEDSFGCWIGHENLINQACANIGKRWICHTTGSRKLYPS